MTTNVLPSSGELKNPNGTLSYTKGGEFTSVDVAWIWSLLIAVTAPYVFTFLKYFWILVFKKTRKLNYTVLFIVSFFKVVFIITN